MISHDACARSHLPPALADPYGPGLRPLPSARGAQPPPGCAEKPRELERKYHTCHKASKITGQGVKTEENGLRFIAIGHLYLYTKMFAGAREAQPRRNGPPFPLSASSALAPDARQRTRYAL